MTAQSRRWTLVGTLAVLMAAYALFFTDWVKPVPIEIASQVRFVMQPKGFTVPTHRPAPREGIKTNQSDEIVKFAEKILRPPKPKIDQAPGGGANVTFSLDGYYRLTRVRVEDIPADGSAPKIVWDLTGKSKPVKSLWYGRVPEGMQATGTSTNAEFLTPGAPYRLLLEAGRRRGTNRFTTAALRLPE